MVCLFVLVLSLTFDTEFVNAKSHRDNSDRRSSFQKAKYPPARCKHSAIYDSVNKQMIIFGGVGRTGYLSDTWVFDIEKKQWKKIETKEVPPARADACAIYDLVNKQMIIFGGIDERGQVLSDTWIFNIEKRQWKEIKAKKVKGQEKK